jgi:hypothetical protein
MARGLARGARPAIIKHMPDERSRADQLLVAELFGEARHHARWEPLDEAEHAAAVAAMRKLAGGRAAIRPGRVQRDRAQQAPVARPRPSRGHASRPGHAGRMRSVPSRWERILARAGPVPRTNRDGLTSPAMRIAVLVASVGALQINERPPRCELVASRSLTVAGAGQKSLPVGLGHC